ncbi:MAG: hypothetical protein RL653_3585 [Pseudomonadota bacterium]|jgi:amidophosphoribosyltransferase
MCGIFGIHGHKEAANLAYLGLHALQHRGQESAGIAAADDGRLHSHRQLGLVADAFSAEVLGQLPGESAIGHVRYATAGGRGLANAQPFCIEYAGGPLAVAHNGNLVNAQQLRDELAAQGAVFQSDSDTEVLLHLVAQADGPTLEQRLAHALRRVQGAYSLVFLAADRLVAVRDPHGLRPLVLGKLRDAWVFASETAALDLIEASYDREVAPGEMVTIGPDGALRSAFPLPPAPPAKCVFEHIYFARPDATLFGKSAYAVRKRLGAQLASEHPADADVVIAVPDSGVPAAMGYAEGAGLPYEVGLIRSHYVGRTFIEPQQAIRHFGVKLKLAAVREVLRGKRVVVVDDSIVRGTTSRKIVKMLKDAGAVSVHLRISSPPTRWPCFYGIDTPSRQELIAATHDVDEIARYVTADSLGYLSLEGVLKAVGDGDGFCTACFSGKYVAGLPGEAPQPALRVVGG